MKYHKINSIFKRDERGNFIPGQWSVPEFEYLKDNFWVFTEKIDGTNIRVYWDGEQVKFAGRTDNAQMPVPLYDKLNELFPEEKFKSLYPDTPMTLYGEGFGAKIQKGGGNYNPTGCDFILFDVAVNGLWLTRDSVVDIASKLEIMVVPVIGFGSIDDAIRMVQKGITSTFGPFEAEGCVIRPEVELLTRTGSRIITKIKAKDFR